MRMGGKNSHWRLASHRSTLGRLNKVPAFVRWTGKIGPGIAMQQVAITMDWTTTILAAGDAEAPAKYVTDGIDPMPIMLKEKDEVERTIYWRTFQRIKQKAARSGEWKYLKDDNGEYLFNLADDREKK